MKMIPSEIGFLDKGVVDNFKNKKTSDSEKDVYRIISKATISSLPEAICYSSIRLPNHLRNNMGEIDFLIISKGIIIVLEVKGGRVAYEPLEDIWLYIDRFNIVKKEKRGPFKQADQAMYSLKKTLEERFKNELNDFLFCKGVIFPDCSFNQDTLEIESKEFLDENLFTVDGFEKWIQQLIQFNLEKEVYKRSGMKKRINYIQKSNFNMKKIQEFIRPKFEQIESLGNRTKHASQSFISLTTDQYEKIDMLEENPRIIISGGAGTGKTLLAINEAKRLASLDNKVLFLCYSKILAGWIQTKFETIEQVKVLDFHSLKKLEMEKSDVLIIDEGQDVISLDNFETFKNLVNGGLEDGIWRVFCDHNNQSNLEGEFELNGLDLLKQLSDGMISKLKTNVRNTKDILDFVTDVTGADLEVSRFGAGVRVQNNIYETLVDWNLNIKNLLDKLFMQQVQLKDVCVLTLGEESDVIDNFPKEYQSKCILVDQNYHQKISSNFIKISSPKNFKGLESKWIIFTDLNHDINFDHFFNHIYVAMTRAQFGLHLIINSETRNKLVEKHLIKKDSKDLNG